MVDFLSFLVEADRVVAVPAAASSYSRLSELDGPWSELPTFEGYSAEIVLGLEPDLLLVHAWQSPETTELVRSSGIPVLLSPLPKSWDDVLATIAELGHALGEEARAEALARALEVRREALLARPHAALGLTALSYSNLGAGGTAAGAGTTADTLLELAGLTNAAAAHGMRGHASLDHERLLAIDPDLFVVGMTESEGELPPSATYLLEQPDLERLAAVRAGRVIALPPRLFTTASPELMRAAEVLADEVERAFAGSGEEE